MHSVCQHCPLMCENEEPHLDTQDHVLKCSKLGGSIVDMVFLGAGDVEQSLVAQEFSRLMSKRAQLLEVEVPSDSCPCLPGAIPDRSTAIDDGGAAAMHV